MDKYSAIVDKLKREILAGKYEASKRFPSGQALANRFKVSRPTINRVMFHLRQAGLVLTRAGAAPQLSRFAEHATGTIGVIHPGCQFGEVMSEICESLVRQGESRGWDVVLRRLEATDPQLRLKQLIGAIRDFSKERVAGLLFQPFEYLDDDASARRSVMAELSQLAIPVVLLDYDSLKVRSLPRYDLVCMDNVAAGRTMGERLLKSGMRQLAFLLKANCGPSVPDRMLGVASAVIAAGGSWSEANNLIIGEPDDRSKLRKFISRNHPDAIVCGNDALALLLHRTLTTLGKADSIKVAGFDNQPAARALGIMSMAQPVDDIAAVALETLISRLQRPEQPVRTIVISGHTAT